MNQQNENLPAEYIPVVQMIQKEESIRKGITALKEKILISAGDEFQSWPEEKQNQFFERTIIAIAKDEKLIECFKSPEGKLSIVEAVEKAVSTSLQIGGKHAYLVPQPRKSNRKDQQGKPVWITEVRFSIRDRGYYALLCGGKKPIFLDLRWGQVYEKDTCTVDKGTGEVKHAVAITDDKGKFLGCWVQCKKINDQLEAEFYPVSKINQWRDSSSAYKDAIVKKYATPWIEWYEEMSLESSIRHFCGRYEEARELLASALYDDEQETSEEKSSVDSINEVLTQQEVDELLEKEKAKKEKTSTTPEKTDKENPEPRQEEQKEELDLF